MSDPDQLFADVPLPGRQANDAVVARQIWLRARIAAIIDDRARIDRLQLRGAVIVIAALDTIAPLVTLAGCAPLFASLAALVAIHTAASLALLTRWHSHE